MKRFTTGRRLPLGVQMLQQLAIVMVTIVGTVLVLVGLVALFRGLSGADPQAILRLIQLSLPVAIFILVVGAGLVGYGAFLTHPESTPTAASDSIKFPISMPGDSPSPAESTAADSPGRVVVTAPEEGTKVSGSKGTRIEGTADDLGKNTLWIMTKSEGAEGKLVYYLSSDAVPPVDGKWSARISDLGAGEDDVGETFTLVVVKADSSCAEKIQNQKPSSDGDIVFVRLPAGCEEVGTRHVLKTSA
jgi:hypothetical protein